MTGNSSTAGHETFDESLLACVEDINKLLPGLSRRYDLTVIMTALAEHVGSALKVLMHKQVCDARQAQRVIKNIESSAFLRKPTPPKAEGSGDSGT
jgi:inhibitor of KinA sporulation pathway (predicted exonuclease)